MNSSKKYLIKTIVLKSIGPMLPLLSVIIALDQHTKTDLSYISIAIQNFTSLVVFGTLPQFLIKIGEANRNWVIQRRALFYARFNAFNGIVVFMLVLLFGENYSINLTALILTLTIIFYNIHVLQRYVEKSEEIYEIKDFRLLCIFLTSLTIYFFCKKYSTALIALEAILLVALVCGEANIKLERIKKIRYKSKLFEAWIKTIKLNALVFVGGFVTPLSLFIVSLIIKKDEGSELYVEFTQTYSIFSIFVFYSNIYLQKLLIGFELKNNIRYIFKYFLRSAIFPVLAMGVILICKHLIGLNFGRIDESVLVLIFISSLVFLAVSMSSQFLYYRGFIKAILVFNVIWMLILNSGIYLVKSLEQIWIVYIFSFVLMFILQCSYLRIKND
jgi:hypothetical protein